MNALYTVLQCVWGAPQTLLGLLVFLFERNRPHFWYHGVMVTRWRGAASLSLGLFVFVSGEVSNENTFRRWLVHEYGHTVQSLFLGPLYLPVVGLPSLVWNLVHSFWEKRQKFTPYTAFYTESWADRLGEKHTGEKVV